MVLCFDIGTTALKAGLVREDGLIAHAAVRALPVDPDNTIDARLWTAAMESSARELLSGPGRGAVEAVVVDANGPTLIAYPDHRAYLWLDRRAQEESALVSREAGLFIDSSFFLPKVLWLRSHRKDVFSRTRFFLGSQDYVNLFLTGEAAALMPLEGLERWYWDGALLGRLGLDEALFPPFVPMGRRIGTLRREVAEAWGMAPAPVIAGCPDFVASIIGTGTMEEGQVCDRSGTSEGLNLCSPSPSPDGRLMSYRHPNGSSWNVSGSISSSGRAIGKAMEILGFGSGEFRDFYNLCASSRRTEMIAFNPYLSGERAPVWDARARGTVYGLTASATRADVALAAAEGVCLAIKDVLEALGGSPRELRVSGGPAQGEFLNQLKADVSGLPVVRTLSPDPDLLGLALVAFAALGRYGSLAEAARAAVRPGRTYVPDPGLRGRYAALLALYRSVYSRVRNLTFDGKD